MYKCLQMTGNGKTLTSFTVFDFLLDDKMKRG